MTTRARLYPATLLAGAALALAVASASANHLSISNRNIRMVWAAIEFEAGESTLTRCPLTLEGSFHEGTIEKVEHTLIGYITRGAFGTCNAGRATLLTATLPWHLRYMGFRGRLPNITALLVLLVGFGFRIESLGFFCLALTSDTNPFTGIAEVNETNGTLTGLRPEPNTNIPTTSSGVFGCPTTSIHFRANTSTVTLLGNTTAITIRLI